MHRLFLYLFCFVCIQHLAKAQKNPLHAILEKPYFRDFVQQPEQYELQIVYTQIDRNAQQQPTFTTYTYGLDTNRYFYPASSVKLPVAVLALQRLRELNIQGLDANTDMFHWANRAPQSYALTDTSSVTGLPSVAQYIKKICLVSDNDAYNRLYEFLGADYINSELVKKGYHSARLITRLGIGGFNAEENRYSNPVQFGSTSNMKYYQAAQFSTYKPKVRPLNELKGKAYMTNEGAIVEAPFDFSEKNFIHLLDLHDVVRSIFFPSASGQFDIYEEDRKFLQRYMGMDPRASSFPSYDPADYPDGYVKFFVLGDTAIARPEGLRIFNKVGYAYGYLTDAAYIVDTETGAEFLIAATIHVNKNRTYNDGIYEYESEGLPFLASLGREVLAMEQQRKRKVQPDLSWVTSLFEKE